MEIQPLNYKFCWGKNENKWNRNNDYKYNHNNKKLAVEENLSADLSALNVMRKKLTHA